VTKAIRKIFISQLIAVCTMRHSANQYGLLDQAGDGNDDVCDVSSIHINPRDNLDDYSPDRVAVSRISCSETRRKFDTYPRARRTKDRSKFALGPI
jgi:hypothetical protein